MTLATKALRTVRVQFLPAGRAVDVPRGSFLTAASIRAGVPIVHDCDGLGVCGTCRVRIEQGAGRLGTPDPREHLQLGEAAIAEGWRLCCVARVNGDATVLVPEGGFAYPPELQRSADPMIANINPPGSVPRAPHRTRRG